MVTIPIFQQAARAGAVDRSGDEVPVEKFRGHAGAQGREWPFLSPSHAHVSAHFARRVARHDTTNLLALQEHFKHASLWLTDYYVGSDLELWTLMMEEEEKLFFESFDKALRAEHLAGPGGIVLKKRIDEAMAQGRLPREFRGEAGSHLRKEMIRNLVESGQRVYPCAASNYCWFRPESALCTQGNQPLLRRCNPGACTNSIIAPAHKPYWERPTRLRGTVGAEAPGRALPEGVARYSRGQQQNPAGSGMKVSAKKLAGLRRYHAERPVKTRLKLLEALDRMESGHTVVVGPEFKWSKTTLAREAGVNINTLVRKRPNGNGCSRRSTTVSRSLETNGGGRRWIRPEKKRKSRSCEMKLRGCGSKTGCWLWKSIAWASRSSLSGREPTGWQFTSGRTPRSGRRSAGYRPA